MRTDRSVGLSHCAKLHDRSMSIARIRGGALQVEKYDGVRKLVRGARLGSRRIYDSSPEGPRRFGSGGAGAPRINVASFHLTRREGSTRGVRL